MATWDDKGNLISMTREEEERKEKYGEWPEPPKKKPSMAVSSSFLKYPVGQEPEFKDDDVVEDNTKLAPIEQPSIERKHAKIPESLLLRSYSATLSTDGDLKSLSQVVSQKAHKSISQSAIIRALVQLAAHDPASIPKILNYVLHEEIKPGRK